MTKPWILLLGVAAGCGVETGVYYGKQARPLPQAKAALASKSNLGHIDTSFAPVEGKAVAKSPYGGTDLVYTGLKDGHVCMSFPLLLDPPKDGETAESVAERRAREFQNAVLRFEARSSFDDLSEQTIWSTAVPPTELDSARVVSMGTAEVPKTNVTKEKKTIERPEATIEVCGKAPAFSDKTRYLTATNFSRDGSRPPAMYVWIVDNGEPQPKQKKAKTSPIPSPAPADAPRSTETLESQTK